MHAGRKLVILTKSFKAIIESVMQLNWRHFMHDTKMVVKGKSIHCTVAYTYVVVQSSDHCSHYLYHRDSDGVVVNSIVDLEARWVYFVPVSLLHWSDGLCVVVRMKST